MRTSLLLRRRGGAPPATSDIARTSSAYSSLCASSRRPTAMAVTATTSAAPVRCNVSFADSRWSTSHLCTSNIHNMQRRLVSSSVPTNPKSSLRKVIRPFLRACHPDAVMSNLDNINNNDDQDTVTTRGNKRPPRHPLSAQAKEVNLKAVQTLNGLIDTLEELMVRCTPPSYYSNDTSTNNDNHRSAASLPELNAKYEIEFILPSSKHIELSSQPTTTKHKRNERESLTLRSITVSFPKDLRANVRKWALTSFPDHSSLLYTDQRELQHVKRQEEEAMEVVYRLRHVAYLELVRLLTIAGMEVPSSGLDTLQRQRYQQQDAGSLGGRQRKEEGEWTLSDHFLYELGIDPTEDIRGTDDGDSSTTTSTTTQQQQQQQYSAFFGRTTQGTAAAPPAYSHPHLRQQRQSFMNSIPWDTFRQNYDQAFLDAQADWTTSRLKLFNPNTREGKERREQLVSQICGGVRVWRNVVDGDSGDDVDEEEVDDIPEGLDVVQQLIAIRRLSLILYDNFDYLQFERMGRMWERLVIVLTPPRNRRNQHGQRKDDTENKGIGRGVGDHPGRKLNKWERRMKRRERATPPSRGRMMRVAETHYNSLKNKRDNSQRDGDTVGDDVHQSQQQQQTQQQRKSTPSINAAESGYKFSYGTRSDQGTGHVTAYIPIDFGSDELVRQLYTHLYDYFDNCCGDVGFFNYGPNRDVSVNADGVGGLDAGSRGTDDEKRNESKSEARV
jgi:hypothetical protein